MVPNANTINTCYWELGISLWMFFVALCFSIVGRCMMSPSPTIYSLWTTSSPLFEAIIPELGRLVEGDKCLKYTVGERSFYFFKEEGYAHNQRFQVVGVLCRPHDLLCDLFVSVSSLLALQFRSFRGFYFNFPRNIFYGRENGQEQTV